MNARAWFYGTSFHGNLQSGVTQSEIDAHLDGSAGGGYNLRCRSCGHFQSDCECCECGAGPDEVCDSSCRCPSCECAV